jgi:hypothetical protein
MICFGCSSNHQNVTGSSEDVNHVDESGKKQGPWKIYSDSVLIARGSYINGKPDGLWTYWYKNGHMKEEGRYKNGIKKGMWIEWYRDGDIMWKGEWQNCTRRIDNLGAEAEISFIGEDHTDRILAADTIYRLKIRINNIPVGNLFVEVDEGKITREEDSDLYILKTPSDSMFTLAVGFIPDLEFKDFRNLVSEIDFRIK